MTSQLAKHLHDVHFGGNWTWVNMKDTLSDITWKEATAKVFNVNTIASLVYHINYYVVAITGVIEGCPLESKDKFSFDVPPIHSQAEWETFLNKVWSDAEKLVALIRQLPADKIEQDFWDNKYGNYLRNLMGLIEHSHYHLGQIVIIKKYLRKSQDAM